MLTQSNVMPQIALVPMLQGAAPARWTLQPDGGIVWKVQSGEAHRDHIEMSGRKVSVSTTYYD